MARSNTSSAKLSNTRAKPKARTAKPPSPVKAASAPGDAIALLEQDHRAVEHLFAQFEDAEGDAEKRALVIAICSALKVHARIEEDLLYPAAASVVDDPALLQEAHVEHASAKDLISQIETGAPGEALFDARVKVLSEYVAHHVAEEEGELFPRCRKAGLDLDALGARLALRKRELMLGLAVSNPILALT